MRGSTPHRLVHDVPEVPVFVEVFGRKLRKVRELLLLDLDVRLHRHQVRITFLSEVPHASGEDDDDQSEGISVTTESPLLPLSELCFTAISQRS